MGEEIAVGWEEWEVTANGYKFSLWDDENVLRLDYDDRGTSL